MNRLKTLAYIAILVIGLWPMYLAIYAANGHTPQNERVILAIGAVGEVIYLTGVALAVMTVFIS